MCVWGMSNWQQALGQTQDMLKRDYVSQQCFGILSEELEGGGITGEWAKTDFNISGACSHPPSSVSPVKQSFNFFMCIGYTDMNSQLYQHNTCFQGSPCF